MEYPQISRAPVVKLQHQQNSTLPQESDQNLEAMLSSLQEISETSLGKSEEFLVEGLGSTYWVCLKIREDPPN